MLQPKKVKYRKTFRGKNRGVATRGTELAFGEYGLRSLDLGEISARQIEAARKKSPMLLKEKVNTGLRSSPASLLLRKLWVSKWAAARAISSNTLRQLSQVLYFLKLVVSVKLWPKMLCTRLLLNYQLKLNLSRKNK